MLNCTDSHSSNLISSQLFAEPSRFMVNPIYSSGLLDLAETLALDTLGMGVMCRNSRNHLEPDSEPLIHV